MTAPFAKPDRAVIERACTYISDDAYIASHFSLTRGEVQAIRYGIRPRDERRFKAARADGSGTDDTKGLDKAREEMTAAGQASAELRDKCLDMFARFEKRHRLAPGDGERLNLAGCRA